MTCLIYRFEWVGKNPLFGPNGMALTSRECPALATMPTERELLRNIEIEETLKTFAGHGPFPSYLYRFRLHHSDICACGEKGDPLHYVTSCHITLSYHFTKPSAENTQLWWKHLLLNKLSRIKIAKLISFLNENENLVKQSPDATSPSDSDPDVPPSPRSQTYGL
ncbi:hypothetical protein AVEN_231262-1 [Araneus ventricosus]|uniref:Uncharacterized protein n=1 Tax=Araneus ventricosus TaxID=182803 RepID=A0A4Y2CIN5_ARAVE|nr:hypothetical protein AVEN_231262-1 [Araneus ventricosus]